MIVDEFNNACASGELETAKQLLRENTEKITAEVMDSGFKRACREGHVEVAQWILSVKPDRDTDILDSLKSLLDTRMEELTEEGIDSDYFVDDEEYQVIEMCIDFINDKIKRK